MMRWIAPLVLLLSLAAADNKTLRQGRLRRTVLEVDTKERAAKLLDSLWEDNGIKPQHRRKLHKDSSRKLKSSSSSSDDSHDMSMSMHYRYYF